MGKTQNALPITVRQFDPDCHDPVKHTMARSAEP
jgi:hypothetical protein